jgi:hypothetical protein
MDVAVRRRWGLEEKGADDGEWGPPQIITHAAVAELLF